MGGQGAKLLSKSSIPYICKIIELCLSIIIVALIIDPTNNGILGFEHTHSGLVYLSWGGYIIINGVFVITFFFGERVPKITIVMFDILGGILHLAASAVVIEDWRRNRTSRTAWHYSKQYQDMAISAGILGLLEALVMLIEAWFHVFGRAAKEEEGEE